MVASPSDDPAALSGLADTLSANVNAGRVFGTDGPMVRVSVSAASTGQTASLELGSPLTISTTDGAVDITVDIQSPTWAEFDKVEYYINTTTTRTTLTNQQTGAGLISVNRYSLTPDAVQTAGVDFTVNTVPVAGTSSSRLEATTTLSLTALTDDIYVVVMVKGTDGVSKPLFPVLPNNLKTSTNTTLTAAHRRQPRRGRHHGAGLHQPALRRRQRRRLVTTGSTSRSVMPLNGSRGLAGRGHTANAASPRRLHGLRLLIPPTSPSQSS